MSLGARPALRGTMVEAGDSDSFADTPEPALKP